MRDWILSGSDTKKFWVLYAIFWIEYLVVVMGTTTLWKVEESCILFSSRLVLIRLSWWVLRNVAIEFLSPPWYFLLSFQCCIRVERWLSLDGDFKPLKLSGREEFLKWFDERFFAPSGVLKKLRYVLLFFIVLGGFCPPPSENLFG